MALSTSRGAPQPLRRIIEQTKGWIDRLGEVWVEAQIVELNRRTTYVQFLTLRDLHSDYSCRATTNSRVLDAAGPIPEGASIVARVKARLYERTTAFSFEVLELHVAGEGRLLAELEQRKRKLQAEGLFDPARKRPLPVLPKLIGLVTGRGSDAERDVIVNATARWPAVRFRVEHALVQGQQSAASVMQALAVLDEDPEVDVIVVARGGGSLEDLLSFSDEGVVRAVAEANTPVVSAIGHENDSPILDLVADVRASTPTDAAKRIVPDVEQELANVDDARSRMRQAVLSLLDQLQRQLDELRSRPVLVDPTSAFQPHHDKLALLRLQMRNAIQTTLRGEEAQLERLLASVRAMSPMKTLERGYAVLASDDGTVSSVKDTAVGTRLRALLADGELGLDVVDITERKRDD